MSRTRSISEVIKGTKYDKLLAVAEKSRKWKRKKITPPPIGHHLAVMIEGEMYFIDNIVILKSHTVLHIDRTHMEVIPFEIKYTDQEQGRIKIYYKNNTEIEVIRIN